MATTELSRSEDKEKLALVGEALVLACDQLGQTIAALHAERDANCHEFAAQSMDVLLTLWQARWELSLTPVAASHMGARQAADDAEASNGRTSDGLSVLSGGAS